MWRSTERKFGALNVNHDEPIPGSASGVLPSGAAETAIGLRSVRVCMERSSQFLLLTIAIDVVLLMALGQLSLPGDPTIYAAVAILVVSPLLTYLIVFRDDYRRPFGG